MNEPTSKTVRAPLFSEQVALSAQLDEASAARLRAALDLAQQGGGNAGKNSGPALRSAGAIIGFFGLGTATVTALVPGSTNTYAILFGLALSAVGLVLLLMAAREEALHGAALVRSLAQALARSRKREPTNPGLPNPLKQ